MIGFPLTYDQLAGLRRIVDAGGRLDHDNTRLLLDAYEALLLRLSAADLALRGDHEGTYFGTDARTESGGGTR